MDGSRHECSVNVGKLGSFFKYKVKIVCKLLVS